MSHSSCYARMLSGLVAAACASAAYADAAGFRVAALPKYQQECAACHMAYPPGMLPVASWARVMNTLDQHYGTDASLDAADVREISGWLRTHAGTYKRVSEEPPQDRITKSAWFLRKHNAHEVPSDAWRRPSVGGAANCAACHGNAAQWRFSEHEIRIPK